MKFFNLNKQKKLKFAPQQQNTIDIYKIVSQHNEVSNEGNNSSSKRPDAKPINLDNPISNDPSRDPKKSSCGCN